MSTKRYVDTSFWRDSYVVTLSPEQKHIFNYLLTNPATNLCGVYELPKKIMAFETGYDVGVMDAVLEKLYSDEKIAYIENWVCLINRPKHQYLSDTINVAITRELDKIPDSVFEALPSKYIEGMGRVWIGYSRGIVTLKPKLKPKLKLKEEKKEESKDSSPAVTKSDPDITRILKSFGEHFGTSTPQGKQVMVAVELLKQHGLERTLGAITAAAAARTERYAPSIGSLEELQDKWVKLETFYGRQINGRVKI